MTQSKYLEGTRAIVKQICSTHECGHMIEKELTICGMLSADSAAAAPKLCRHTSILEKPSFSSLNELYLAHTT